MQDVISQKEVRMLIKMIQEHKEPQLIRAYLTKDFTYHRKGVDVVVPSGKLIVVDTANNIALIDDVHVGDVKPDEYSEVLYS